MELNALKTTVILNPRQLYWSKLMQKRKKIEPLDVDVTIQNL